MRYGGVHRVVVKRRLGRWSYYGDYRFVPVRNLSVSEWNELSVQVSAMYVWRWKAVIINKYVLQDRGMWAAFLLKSASKAMQMRVAFSKFTGREASSRDLEQYHATLVESAVTVNDALYVWSLGLAVSDTKNNVSSMH